MYEYVLHVSYIAYFLPGTWYMIHVNTTAAVTCAAKRYVPDRYPTEVPGRYSYRPSVSVFPDIAELLLRNICAEAPVSSFLFGNKHSCIIHTFVRSDWDACIQTHSNE